MTRSLEIYKQIISKVEIQKVEKYANSETKSKAKNVLLNTTLQKHSPVAKLFFDAV